jgi:putative ATPase
MNAPLAERMRPQTLDDLVGQEHLTGPGSILRKALEQGKIPSMILWGPPGVGKTTIAHILASSLQLPYFTLSAIASGVKDIREVIERTQTSQAILFIDEIHRFNKSQQDALLGAVERGTITLIGATTENPSFEVNAALLSRCQVYVLRSLQQEHFMQLLQQALDKDFKLQGKQVVFEETEALFNIAGGDARKLLNLFELVTDTLQEEAPIVITNQKVMDIAQQRVAIYDKTGEQHYDIISAFIKSIRGSDPNAAVYYLARMLAGGEDVKFIARRLVILASEDIGNANPNALLLATSTFQAVSMIGLPESRIILSQCVTYLASSAKSNASYMAINQAQTLVAKTGDLPVPMHIRNAPTKLMKDQGYGKGYAYAHDYQNNFVQQEFLPDAIRGKKLYDPGKNAREEELRKYLRQLWKEKYGY